MASSIDQELRFVLPRRSVRQHLADIWKYRELWQQLVRKELHVRYQKSVLGFAWSMLNPLFLLVVYSIVFGFLGQSFAWFAIWLLAGILVWNFFATSLSTGTQSITAQRLPRRQGQLPREILPLASVGAAFVHLMLSQPADGRRAARHPLPRRLVATSGSPSRRWSPWSCSPPAFAILLSAVNVYARDTTHLLELALLAWFWLTPIIYRFELVADKLAQAVGITSTGTCSTRSPRSSSPSSAASTARRRSPTAKAPARSSSSLPDLSQWWYLRNIGIVFVARLRAARRRHQGVRPGRGATSPR